MIALVKAGHIAFIAIWCAGLIALPVILQIYGRRDEIRTQEGFSEFRLLLHAGYTRIVTPAAILAIALGTVLIFMADLRTDWLMVKLVAVSGMVLVHAWLGHLILKTAEGRGTYDMPSPLIALPIGALLMAAVFALVLAKPDLTPLVERLPQALQQPQDRELPEGFVPI